VLASEGPDTVPIRNRIARRLVSDMSPAGAVGRGGIDFVFDSAMALTGLISHQAVGGMIPDPAAIDRLFDYVARTLRSRRAYTGATATDPNHWSVSYGCHLLKTSIALLAYEAQSASATVEPILDQLVDDLGPLYDGGRFRVNAASTATYLHAHCYALEGLIEMQALDARCSRLVRGGASWLADIQDSSGGIRAWHDGTRSFGPLRADATSQAVRIWTIVDRTGFSAPIDDALRFLRSLTTSDGGLRYEPGSDDANTWASIFGLQAFRWADEGGKWQWLA
jgi:hypothetical protein